MGADLVNLDFELVQQYTGGVNMPAPAQAGYVCIADALGTNLTYVPFGSLPTAVLDDNAVTNAKLANMLTGTVKARLTAGTGDPEDVTLAALASALGVGSVADDSITNAKLRESAALSVIGNATNATANPADIAATTDGHVLRRSGTALGFGQVATGGIADNAITNAKFRQAFALTLLGNATSSTANVDDITAGTDGHVMRRAGTALGFGQIVAAGVTDGTLTNAKLANMTDATVKGRALGAGTGAPVDISRTQLRALVISCVAATDSFTPNSSVAAHSYSTEILDTDGFHSTASNQTRFAAPATGTYLILSQAQSSVVGIDSHYLRRDGTTDLTFATTDPQPFVYWIGSLSSGQYVEQMLDFGGTTGTATSLFFMLRID